MDSEKIGKQYESTPSSGSLLATKGGFHNMRNKDQIKDQMLASISKIKSFRETGEFDISNLSNVTPSTHHVMGLSETHDGNMETRPDYPSRHQRGSDQVLMAEPTIDAREPQIIEESET